MSLPHALLTSLLEKPSSGSELARRFSKSIGYFWQATHQQIYRELARLEKQGWVASEAEEGARGRKKTYSVLPRGRDELVRWMTEPSEQKPLRDEMMVRVRAGAIIGTQGLRRDLLKRLHSHQAQLDEYLGIDARNFSPAPLTKERKLQHLLLRAGIDYESMYIKFCKNVLAQLDNCD